ncbi:unnamed protein product [Closterium sp. Naga37s-1]|nr:unnamed protein product [Closterium sp. Naga37s-1]
MGGGLIAVDQRASDGGPVLELGEEGEAGEVLLHSQPDVGLVLGESDVDESGNLYITSKRVIWHSTHTPHGIAVSLVDLSMHAISRDLEAYPKPCIYTQVDTGDWEDEEEEDEEEEEGEGEEEEGEGEGARGAGAAAQPNHVAGSEGGAGGRGEGGDEEMREAEGEARGSDVPAAAAAAAAAGAGAAVGNGSVANVSVRQCGTEFLAFLLDLILIVASLFSSSPFPLLPPPSSPYPTVDAIFKALCDSAALNPDPEGAEQEGEGDWYYNEDEVLSNARVVLPEGDPDQFEDADEDEEEEDEGAGAAAGS